MSDVPSDLYREILLRLPAESLLRFRTVCKSWRLTIDDSSFVKSHTATNKFSPSTLLIRTTAGELFSLNMDSLNFTSNGERTIDVTQLDCLAFQGAPRPPDFPVASCNGLILILHFARNKTWAIWNPLTHESHELPRLEAGSVELVGCGFGYDSVSDDYKVVRIDLVLGDVECAYRTLIYSLRSNSWKKIMNCPFNFQWASDGVFFEGALHWRSMRHLVSLDLATEVYRRVALPPSRTLPYDLRLDVLGGCLVLSNSMKTEECAWVMKDCCDGVDKKKKRAWVKMFSSRERSVIGNSKGLLFPVAYSKSQRELILQNKNKIVMWDIEGYSAKEVTINGPLDIYTSQIFPGSLFRFKDVVGGGADAEVNSTRENGRTRMRWSVTTTDFKCFSDSDCSSCETERESDQSRSGSEGSTEIETETEDDEVYHMLWGVRVRA